MLLVSVKGALLVTSLVMVGLVAVDLDPLLGLKMVVAAQRVQEAKIDASQVEVEAVEESMFGMVGRWSWYSDDTHWSLDYKRWAQAIT